MDTVSNVEQTLTQSLAGFAHSLTLDHVPKQARQEAKLCILDTLGCILAGSGTSEGRSFFSAERQLSTFGSHHTQCVLSPNAMSRVFAYWGDTLELNDLLGGHASIGNVTAALIGAMGQNSSGEELMRAVIAGLEITSRLEAAISPRKKPYEELGNVYVSMVSSYGAAAAVSLLHKLSEVETGHAMAISGALANWGPAEVIFGDGGTIKPIQFGASPADGALRAVSYAQNGLTGPIRLIESKIGWLPTFTYGYDDYTIRRNDIWYLMRPQRKLHACCGFTHSCIDAVVELRKKGIDFSKIQTIELGIPERITSAISKMNVPSTPNEARFHIQYCTALAAGGVDVILPEHSIHFENYMNQPEMIELMGKIGIKSLASSSLPEPVTSLNDIYNQSVVRITDKDNQMFEQVCTAPRGSRRNPLSEKQIADKFRSLASLQFDSSVIDSCIERIMLLEEQNDCHWIFEMLDQSLLSASQN